MKVLVKVYARKTRPLTYVALTRDALLRPESKMRFFAKLNCFDSASEKRHARDAKRGI